jgi:hypothetical protein
MTYLTKSFFIGLLPPVQAADLETTLKRNQTYKSFSDNLNSNQEMRKAAEKLKVKLGEGSSEPKLIFEDQVDDKPCEHCPKFLNLTKAVNKIVENVKGSDSISEANDQLIQVNKLKFLYYVVRSEADTGEINCKKRGEKENLRSPVIDGQIKTVTETMMNISAVTDVQYIPKGRDEVYYYYRGEGANSNVVIEVKMNKDGTSRMRYFDYQASDGSSRHYNLPELSTPQNTQAKAQSKKDDNHLEVGIDIKTGNDLLPKDINFVSAGTQIKLADDLKISTDHQVGFNQQSTTIALQNDKGSAIASISGTNINSGKKSVVATLPMEVIIDTDNSMKLNGSIINEFSVSGIEGKSTLESKRSVTLGLTDKNHEYITIKADSTNSGVQGFEVSSKYKLGESSSLGAGYQQSNNGTKNFNINNVAKLDNYGTLTTSFGRNSDGDKFVQTQLENKISDTSSMIVSIKVDSQKEKVFMYQFSKVF